jgi:Ser/Thr protein kinase RdoA (MazF antagonist)
MNNFFYHLTPDVILQAAQRHGFDATGHCLALNSYENRVYDLKIHDNSHIVIKFYRPGRWNRDQIREEHQFLLELKQDEIPVCAPLFISEGETIGVIENIFYAIWPRTGGRGAEELTDQELQILGRLLARIHNMGAVKNAEHRIRLNGENYGLKPLNFLLENKFLPLHCESRYKNAVAEIVDIYQKLATDIPFHRIHGDCHTGNLLQGRDGWFFLDFDDFLTGPAVQDIWMIVPARDTEGLRQREVFLEAYRQFRDFDQSWLRLIEPLRALRYIWYAGWLAKRWEDPAFPPAFPHFGTTEYWENETSDLEKQLEYIYKNISDLPDALPGKAKREQKEEDQELTNKDFFWDWEE